MIDYSVAKNWNPGACAHSYGERDSILYALGIGFGSDPMDTRELQFVYEDGLQAALSMAAVIGTPGFIWRQPEFGADWVKVLHGEQDIRWFGPIPAAGAIVARNSVTALADKGPGKGAVAEVTRLLFAGDESAATAEVKMIVLLRGDGGFSRAHGLSDPVPSLLPPIPADSGPPDREVAVATSFQAALIYRLSGDWNPLHASPSAAKQAGYPRPILHGLCTYGMALRALLKGYLNYDQSRVRRLAVRFSSPVYPGETVHFQFWRAGTATLRIRARVLARDAVVLDNGVVELS